MAPIYRPCRQIEARRRRTGLQSKAAFAIRNTKRPPILLWSSGELGITNKPLRRGPRMAASSARSFSRKGVPGGNSRRPEGRVLERVDHRRHPRNPDEGITDGRAFERVLGEPRGGQFAVRRAARVSPRKGVDEKPDS